MFCNKKKIIFVHKIKSQPECTVCRICISAIDPLEELFRLEDKIEIDKDQITFSDVLKMFASVNIKQDHAFPNTICNSCKLLAIKAYTLWKMCMNSEKKLLASLLTSPRKPPNEKFKFNSIKKKTESKHTLNKLSNKSIQERNRRTLLRNARKDTQVPLELLEASQGLNSTDDLTRTAETILTPKPVPTTVNIQEAELISTAHKTETTQKVSKTDEFKLKINETVGNQDVNSISELKHETNNITLDLTNLRKHLNEQIRKPVNLGASSEPEFPNRKPRQMRSGPPLYICEFCGRDYWTHNSLDVHLRMHTGEMPFVCKQCGKSFGRKECLKKHEDRHSDTMYKCEKCGKCYNAHVSLMQHLRSHVRDLRRKCSVCNKLVVDLKGHALVHSDQKNCICVYCGKGFKRKDALDIHIRIHTGEKPFLCNICGEGFRVNCLLQSHIAKHHSDENPPQKKLKKSDEES